MEPTNLGCTPVAVASNLTDALDKAAVLDIDMAILDVNLKGQPVYPVAELLAVQGRPLRLFHAAAVLAKPFEQNDVGAALTLALAAAGHSNQ